MDDPSTDSLSKQLESLVDPSPNLADPEDDFGLDSSAKMWSTKVAINEPVDHLSDKVTVSDLRRRTTASLYHSDQRYRGTKVDRRALDDDDDDDEEEEDGDDQLLNDSLQQLQNEDNESDSQEDIEFYDDNTRAPTASSEDLESDNVSESNSNVEEIEQITNEVNDITDSNDDYINQFSNIDVCDQVSKGKALKNQILIWDNLLECRIKIQKLMIESNKFPQFNYWSLLKESNENLLNPIQEESNKTIENLLHCLLAIDSALNTQNEIFETEDTDQTIDINIDDIEPKAKTSLKRKSSDNCLNSSLLSKRHRKICNSRAKILDMWYEKTRFTSGSFKHKSMTSLEQSCTQQIDRILSDMERLIRRTQTKRSLYDIVGKNDNQKQIDSCAEMSDIPTETTDSEVDPEIFDDDDFYHQMLRELVESKTNNDSSDPKFLSAKWIQIQKLRNKMKRKVDTKASKGRKIRYQVHPKLVNFMAPSSQKSTNANSHDHLLSDEAKSQLFASLFGHKPSGQIA